MEKEKHTTIVFGEVLRRLRLERDLTQDRLGLASSLGRNYIALLEKGERAASLHALLSLAKGLDLRLWEFMKIFESELDRSGRS